MQKIDRTIRVSKELITASGGKLVLGVVTAKVKVEKISDELWSWMSKLGEDQKIAFASTKMDSIPEIKAVRDTYKQLGLKVADYKGSNEALLSRIIAGKGLYQINTIVDANNFVSVKSLRSIGSYDISKLSGDIIFRKGNTNETYVGTTNRPVKLNNLPVLCDDIGPFGSPTSDSQRALIKDDTKEVMTVIFSFDGDVGIKEQVEKIAQLFLDYSSASNVSNMIISPTP